MSTRIALSLACAACLLLAIGGVPLQAGPGAPAVSPDVDPAIANAPWDYDILQGSPYDDFGQYASLAIDKDNGDYYVSFYEATGHDLWLARHVSTGGNCGPHDDWNCELVASADDVGQYSSMDVIHLGGFGHPWRLAIAYYNATYYTLELAEYVCVITCSWNFETISDPSAGTAGSFASMEYDSTGQVHIAYYYHASIGDVGHLMYAHEVTSGGNCGAGAAAGEWQCDSIDSGYEMGRYASLALNDANLPRIAYFDGNLYNLKLATLGADGQPANCGPGSNTWTCRIIDGAGTGGDVGEYASLAVDATGTGAGIAYYDRTNTQLKYAQYAATGGNCGYNTYTQAYEWQCDVIENIGQDLVMGISLARYASGHPIIAYHDAGETTGRLKVARPVGALGTYTGNCGPQILFYTWQCDRVGASGYHNGQHASIALNSAELAFIVSYDDRSPESLLLSWQSLRVGLPVTLLNGP